MKNYCALCCSWVHGQLRSANITYEDGTTDEIAVCKSCFDFLRREKNLAPTERHAGKNK